MTAILCHVPALSWLGLLRWLCHTITTSVAANPVLDRPVIVLPTFIQWYVIVSSLRLPLYTNSDIDLISATTADGLYLYNQSGSVRVNRPFHQQHKILIYLLSHAISVV